MAEDMALGLLRLREPSGLLGKTWIYNFIKRHETLSATFSKQIEHRRALQSNNSIILNMYFDGVGFHAIII